MDEVRNLKWQDLDLDREIIHLKTVKSVYTNMHGDEELIPFQITINGKTYGSADGKLPVWMQ